MSLVANLTHFGRLLRRAGMPVGPGKVLDALAAAQAVGLGRRDDFYAALHAVFVNRREHHELFDQAFRLFWREPPGLEAAMAALLPQAERPARPRGETISRRVAEALHPSGRPRPPSERPKLVFDAAMTVSDREVLRGKDFEQMSEAELRVAERVVRQLVTRLPDLPTRRLKPDPGGRRLDMRATLRAAVRAGGADLPLRWRSARTRPPALCVLCDVSGSMARYARLLLVFLHALTRERERVHSFVFGTRLTNVTRCLRHRDADVALRAIGRAAADFAGGTRIGASLREFNVRWSRRVLAQGAVVLFISDGLEREAGPEELGKEMARLSRSCRRLIWLNPLLRFSRFEPLAQGVKAILPHVDEHRPVHNLASLEDLAAALGKFSGRGRPGRLRRRRR